MKKINERAMTKNFIQQSLYNQLIQEKHENRILKEAGFTLGGLGFGNSRAGTGFSSQPKITVQTWSDWDDDISEAGEGHAVWDESQSEDGSMEGSVDESFESLAGEGYFDDGYNQMKPGDHYDTGDMFGMGMGEDDYFDEGEEGAAEQPPKLDKKGNISPKELHKHFDLNGDGDVDMYEYTDHIDFHSRHPELLEKWRQMKKKSQQNCADPESYCLVGDALMNDYEDILGSLENMMSGCGANCHSSSAKALSDVVRMLQDLGVL